MSRSVVQCVLLTGVRFFPVRLCACACVSSVTVPSSSAVFISGCSSGIGRAAVGRLLGAGWIVVASVRREEDAVSLRGELRNHPSLHTLVLDISDEKQVEAAAAEVQSVLAQRAKLCAIVCNAGYAGQLTHHTSIHTRQPALARSLTRLCAASSHPVDAVLCCVVSPRALSH